MATVNVSVGSFNVDEICSHFFQEEFHRFGEIVNSEDVTLSVCEQLGSKKVVFQRVYDADAT